MQTIGVIGVGHIGKGFVEVLLAADHEVVVYDVDEAKHEWARERGASTANSPADLATQVDCVVMALPGTPEVEETMAGSDGDGDGVLAGASEGLLVVDASTTLPQTSIDCEVLCDAQGVPFVEAPITGGSPREGMHVMVGATEANYAAATEVLDVLCADHVRIGAVGEATIFKLGLQLRYAGHHAIDAEVVAFCRDNGVDPRPLNDFLELGVSERYFSGEFDQAIEGMGGLAIWHKDVGYARQVAREGETALPLAGVVHEAYKATVRRAGEDEGHAAALLRYWLALNDDEAGFE